MGTDLGTPKLYAEHVPDVDRSLNPDLTVSEVELPGFLEVGVDVNGTRVVLARVKAGHHVDDQGSRADVPAGRAARAVAARAVAAVDSLAVATRP
jgi:hypothetical protein